MQDSQSSPALEDETLRHKMIPLFATNVDSVFISLHRIEIVLELIGYLQLLKFSIDYFALDWFGSEQAIFSYLDVSFYLNLASAQSYQMVLIAGLIYMNLYWLVCVSIFISKKSLPALAGNIRNLFLLFNKTVLYLPLVNLVMNINNCSSQLISRPCFGNYSLVLTIFAFLSLFLFTIFTLGQAFLHFQFLPDLTHFRRLKNSAYSAMMMMVCMLTTEISFYFLSSVIALIVLNLNLIVMLAIFLLKDDHQNERMKLVELTAILINLLAIFLEDIVYFTDLNFSFLLFCLLAILLAIAIQHIELHSLKFELENINKWPTPDIMMKYAKTMRYYLSCKDQFSHLIFIHGYAEIHRQRCDNPACPYRANLQEMGYQIAIDDENYTSGIEIFRSEELIKKIYNDGLKLTPVNAELQLEFATFLFLQNQKEASLKNLLLIKPQSLSFDQFYRYYTLKNLIHHHMDQEPEKQFLDLVSELTIKKNEEEIMKKFEKAALINLQFWSILNEDHPDFQKLNQVGALRIEVRSEVVNSYQEISRIAHSEKITRLFVHYLEAIENDQAMHNDIYEDLFKKYDLHEKIILQDWVNSSHPTILISIETATFATIIDVNFTCALLFGFEKFEIINRSLNILFHEEIRDTIKEFLNPRVQDQMFLMTHKNGYFLKVKRINQNYNSMETGMASICTLSLEVSPTTISLVMGKDERLLGVSSSAIGLLGIENKLFESEMFIKTIFTKTISELSALQENSFPLSQLFKKEFEKQIDHEESNRYNVKMTTFSKNHQCLDLILVKEKNIGVKSRIHQVQTSKFEFQIQANLDHFKYVGNANHQENFLSQFSQLNYADSLKNSKSIKDYGEKINTLRLVDNIIQVIEDPDQKLEDYNAKNQAESESQVENLARKDQQMILASRTAFQKFIEDYSMGKWLNAVLIVTAMAIIAIYLAYFYILQAQLQSITPAMTEIVNQNLIIGALNKEQSLLKSLQLMKVNSSEQDVSRFQNIYVDNLNYLQSIKLLGSVPYQIPVVMTNSTSNFFSDQFILTYINNGMSVYGNMSQAKTLDDLVNIYNSADPHKLNYLLSNSNQTKTIMANTLLSRSNQIKSQIGRWMNTQLFMLVGALLFLTVIAVVLIIGVSKISKEKINIMEVFLGITDIQIQQFSSKTEKFLVSLHVEDGEGDNQIDVDEEVENAKKLNSSTFAKKKKFKSINFSKGIYMKLLIIPILAAAFFLHTFFACNATLRFSLNSFDYFTYTSEADSVFYGGLSNLQEGFLRNTTSTDVLNQLSYDFIIYYRNYFDLHYATYGTIDQFHTFFTNLFMLDCCEGTVQIKESCELPLLYPNGSYLIFTDLTVQTLYLNSTILPLNYLIDFEVLSKAHRLLTQKLLVQQSRQMNEALSSLFNALIIWIFIVNVTIFLYGVPTMKNFVDDINVSKNIVSILPLSIARQLPAAKRYLRKIINEVH